MNEESSLETTSPPVESPSYRRRRDIPRRLRIIVAFSLIIFTIQGWFGDTVNIFVVQHVGPNTANVSADDIIAAALVNPIPMFQGMLGLGFLVFWHALEGLILVILTFIVLIFSFKWSNKKSVWNCSILGILFTWSAAVYAGLVFLLSGFSSGADSAQMGGSFIGRLRILLSWNYTLQNRREFCIGKSFAKSCIYNIELTERCFEHGNSLSDSILVRKRLKRCHFRFAPSHFLDFESLTKDNNSPSNLISYSWIQNRVNHI